MTPATAGGENWALAWEEIVRDYINIMNAPDQYSKDLLDKDGLAHGASAFQDKSPFYVFYELVKLPDRRRVAMTNAKDKRGQHSTSRPAPAMSCLFINTIRPRAFLMSILG